MRFIPVFILSLMLSSTAMAELLPAHKAFVFSVQSSAKQQATLTWDIQPNYYLYQQKISVKQADRTIKLNLPKATSQYDENFGHSQVYWNHLSFNIKVEKNKTYTVMWQGCAKDQVCYAPQRMQFQTDATGAVISPTANFSLKSAKPNSIFTQSKVVENESTGSLVTEKKEMLVETKVDDKKSPEKEVLVPQKDEKKQVQSDDKESGKQTKLLNNHKDEVKAENKQEVKEETKQVLAKNKTDDSESNPNSTAESEVSSASTENINHVNQQQSETVQTTLRNKPVVMAQDQHWLEQLQQHSFMYAVLLFIGLGFLLAFTPCSLPMIPILSSLLVREHKGVKAWTIALVFVLSMASVYAVMGFIASSAGLGLQRWLQQPTTVIGFAILFVIFALNLFGVFEIKLPHRIVQRLDHWQSLQQGGTLLSAGIMGMLSALLVGPCMTAPLAGVLLFIAQSEYQWQGAVLLFSMGFGMGIPLLLVSILGEKALPKAGAWMNQVKVFFGFMMLALALYFIRPLLPSILYQSLMVVLALSALAYILYHFMWKNRALKWLYNIMVLLSLAGIAYYHYQQYQETMSTETHSLVWQKVHHAAALNQAITQAKGKLVIIDVYADWCVSCQPIERLFKQADVQQALQNYVAIKLDLSEYDPEHQALLDELDVLGPPTVMFLDEQGQEIRQLRLTGSFKQHELMQRIQWFNQ